MSGTARRGSAGPRTRQTKKKIARCIRSRRAREVMVVGSDAAEVARSSPARRAGAAHRLDFGA